MFAFCCLSWRLGSELHTCAAPRISGSRPCCMGSDCALSSPACRHIRHEALSGVLSLRGGVGAACHTAEQRQGETCGQREDCNEVSSAAMQEVQAHLLKQDSSAHQERDAESQERQGSCASLHAASDVRITIDFHNRAIHVLDVFGVSVNARTGMPRPRPAVPVHEVPIPDSVSPDQVFRYAVAGHGDVILRAPAKKRGMQAGLGTIRRDTILTLAPPPEVGSVHGRFLRGPTAVALNNGSEYELGIPEQLNGGSEGGSGNGSLPAEVMYIAPHTRFVPWSSESGHAEAWADIAAGAGVAGITAGKPSAASRPPCGPSSVLNTSAPAGGGPLARASGQEQNASTGASHGDGMEDDETCSLHASGADGVWVMGRVEGRVLRKVLEEAMGTDSNAAWQLHMHANGSLLASKVVEKKRKRWLGNPFGPSVCEREFRERQLFGRYILPDVHFGVSSPCSQPPGSPNSSRTGCLAFPPLAVAKHTQVWEVNPPEQPAPAGAHPRVAGATQQTAGHAHYSGQVAQTNLRKRMRHDGPADACVEEDLAKNGTGSASRGLVYNMGRSKRRQDGSQVQGRDVVQEEKEKEEEEEEEVEEEEEGIGLKVRAKYGRWVAGDCRMCSTLPPSPLALLWLPKCLRKDYRAYLNVSAAAEAGSVEAQRRLANDDEFNVTMLVERIGGSLRQRKSFNGGRLRMRYPLHAPEVRCAFCKSTWTRTPWLLDAALNETLEPSTFEWYSNRKLWAHCQEGDVEEILLTLDTLPASMEARDDDFYGGLALHHAAWHGHAPAVKCLLERGCPVSVRDDYNWTALHHACHNGQEEAARALLEAGASANEAGGLAAMSRYPHDFRPLHWAAHMGHAPVIRLLISHGADVHAKDGDGRAALFLSTRWAHVAAVEELLAGGASPRQRCVWSHESGPGLTPAELAERLGLAYQFPDMALTTGKTPRGASFEVNFGSVDVCLVTLRADVMQRQMPPLLMCCRCPPELTGNMTCAESRRTPGLPTCSQHPTLVHCSST